MDNSQWRLSVWTVHGGIGVWEWVCERLGDCLHCLLLSARCPKDDWAALWRAETQLNMQQANRLQTARTSRQWLRWWWRSKTIGNRQIASATGEDVSERGRERKKLGCSRRRVRWWWWWGNEKEKERINGDDEDDDDCLHRARQSVEHCTGKRKNVQQQQQKTKRPLLGTEGKLSSKQFASNGSQLFGHSNWTDTRRLRSATAAIGMK